MKYATELTPFVVCSTAHVQNGPKMRCVRIHTKTVRSATGHTKSGSISQRCDRGQGTAQKKALVISSADQLLEARTRRDFLKVIGVGGILATLPSVLLSP